MFSGAISAIITPFRDGAVDTNALRDLVEWEIASGVDGIVPCGSTGESAYYLSTNRGKRAWSTSGSASGRRTYSVASALSSRRRAGGVWA